MQRENIDVKWWFERPSRNGNPDQTYAPIDPLLLVHDPPIAQAKGRPTDIQRNLRQEKEKEKSTQQDPSRFELVDRALEKSSQHLSKSLATTASSPHVSQAKQTISPKPPPKFRRPDAYLSGSSHRLSILGSGGNCAHATRRQKTAREEEGLLEKRIKEIEAELRSLGASRKDIREIHGAGVREFFNKARRWRAENIENDLLQRIDDEDVELNETISAERMTRSNGMDQIWERYDEAFLAEPRNRIHRLDKARFEAWAKETGYTYTPIQIPPSQLLLDKMYQERREAKELFYVSKEDEKQYVQDTALLRRVTLREQGRVPPEDITEEEQSSNESDPEPDLDDEEDETTHNISHPRIVPKTTVTRSLKPLLASTEPRSTHQRDSKDNLIIREHITCSGRVTSFKVPAGLHRDGTQIRNLRQQD